MNPCLQLGIVLAIASMLPSHYGDRSRWLEAAGALMRGFALLSIVFGLLDCPPPAYACTR